MVLFDVDPTQTVSERDPLPLLLCVSRRDGGAKSMSFLCEPQLFTSLHNGNPLCTIVMWVCGSRCENCLREAARIAHTAHPVLTTSGWEPLAVRRCSDQSESNLSHGAQRDDVVYIMCVSWEVNLINGVALPMRQPSTLDWRLLELIFSLHPAKGDNLSTFRIVVLSSYPIIWSRQKFPFMSMSFDWSPSRSVTLIDLRRG